MQQAKRNLRMAVLEKRRMLDGAERREKSGRISAGIIDWLDGRGIRETGGALFSFVPFGEEVDILPVLEWCWSKGIPTVVPKTVAGTKTLELRYVNHEEQLHPGRWGILEPKPDRPLCENPAAIGHILVPGVAFDRKGRRLGYGGGYYDRFFQMMDGLGLTPFKLAPAFALQVVPEVPAGTHDIPVDAIWTEQGMIGCVSSKYD